jgi:NAD(P)-dependent dehydrogenase (short-subunit alcohol dehydrogenase family)
MDLGLADRTAIVTGGDSGIGWHTAALLLAEGVRVIISDRDTDKLEKAAQALDGEPGQLHTVAADITQPSSVDRMREQVQSIGRVDIVVNAAGTTGATGDFSDIGDEGWSETLETDLLGQVRVTRAFLPDLRASGRGRLIFLASENAVQPYATEIPYDCAKAAVLALAKGLSKSYAREGLLVNCVSPAFVQTPMTDAMMAQRSQQLGVSTQQAVDSFLDEQRPTLELHRRGQPEEVAAVIAFLCSDRASFVNGSNYRVDGGSVATIN